MSLNRRWLTSAVGISVLMMAAILAGLAVARQNLSAHSSTQPSGTGEAIGGSTRIVIEQGPSAVVPSTSPPLGKLSRAGRGGAPHPPRRERCHVALTLPSASGTNSTNG